MNCCQPRQAGFGEPAQTVELKKLVLSWSEKVLATCPPTPPTTPLSVAPAVTLSKEPVAAEIRPELTRAEKSTPLPTVWGLSPCLGG